MQTWTEVQKKKVKKKLTLIFSLDDPAAQMDGWMDASLSLWVPLSAGFLRAGRVMATHTA